ncbi:hypothetical protein BKA56DRAFT_16683 [Ilyonectria sp. MPI-CAGE-AT-0026]|nr:hypothetical protein BKA56DRAFT_16683 [Ilyonectria sp. MPI-CAGE-AT-0026]
MRRSGRTATAGFRFSGQVRQSPLKSQDDPVPQHPFWHPGATPGSQCPGPPPVGETNYRHRENSRPCKHPLIASRGYNPPSSFHHPRYLDLAAVNNPRPLERELIHSIHSLFPLESIHQALRHQVLRLVHPPP